MFTQLLIGPLTFAGVPLLLDCLHDGGVDLASFALRVLHPHVLGTAKEVVGRVDAVL